jgi:hypothetical protein
MDQRDSDLILSARFASRGAGDGFYMPHALWPVGGLLHVTRADVRWTPGKWARRIRTRDVTVPAPLISQWRVDDRPYQMRYKKLEGRAVEIRTIDNDRAEFVIAEWPTLVAHLQREGWRATSVVPPLMLSR